VTPRRSRTFSSQHGRRVAAAAAETAPGRDHFSDLEADAPAEPGLREQRRRGARGEVARVLRNVGAITAHVDARRDRGHRFASIDAASHDPFTLI